MQLGENHPRCDIWHYSQPRPDRDEYFVLPSLLFFAAQGKYDQVFKVFRPRVGRGRTRYYVDGMAIECAFNLHA